MNGFEWRFVAAGLGWGVLVGVVTGVVATWSTVLTEGNVAGGEAVVALLILAFYASLFGVVMGAVAGLIVGTVLSVVVGRQANERVAAVTAAVVTVVLAPVLTWLGLDVLGWTDRLTRGDALLWLLLLVPTLLGAWLMARTARSLARRNSAEFATT